MRGDPTGPCGLVVARLGSPSSLVNLELGRVRQEQGTYVAQLAHADLTFDHLTHGAARQPNADGDSAVGVVAWISALRSACSFAWLSVQWVRRRRRSSRGTSPVT